MSGKTPFAGENPVQTLLQHIASAPEPLSSRFANLNITSDLNYVVMRCLEKHPDDRYQTAQELRDDLMAIADGRALNRIEPKRRESQTRVIAKLTFQSQAHLIGTIIVSVALFVALIALTMNLATTANSIQQQWAKLDKAGQRAFDRGEYASAERYFDQALELAERSDSNRQLLEASLNELSDLARACNQLDEARWLDARISGIQREILGTEGDIDKKLDGANEGKIEDKSTLIDLANTANDQIANLAESGHFEAALRLLAKVTSLTREKIGSDSEVMTRCLHNAAYVEHDMGNLDGAIEKYEEALLVERKVLPEDHVHIATTLLLLTRAQLQAGQTALAKMDNQLREALSICEKIYGKESPRAAWVKYHLALLHHQCGDRKQAVSELNAALAALSADKEPDQEKLARCYALLARIANDANHYERAISLYESQQEKDYPFIIIAFIDYATLIAQDKSKFSQNLLKRAEAMIPHVNGENQQQRLRSSICKQLALSLRAEGESAAAESLFVKACEAARRGYGEDSAEALSVLLELAKFYDDSNALDKAGKSYQKLADLLGDHKGDPKFQLIAGQLNFRLDHFSKRPGAARN